MGGEVLAGKVERVQEGPAWIVLMHGDHDLSTAPNLIAELEQALDPGGPVVVVLSDDHFMDSAIVRPLLTAREQALARRGGSFAVVAPPDGFPSRVLGHVRALIPTYQTWPRRWPPSRMTPEENDGIDVALASSANRAAGRLNR